MKTLYESNYECLMIEAMDLAALLPERIEDSHKGTYGSVLVIAGSVNMCGASFFAAKAAYLSGAGLVRIYAPRQNRIILQELLPEAMLVTYDPEHYGRSDLRILREELKKADVCVAGCGLGQGKTAKKILSTVCREAEVPLVLDADALNLMAEDPKLSGMISVPAILTPHMGEMSRLSGMKVEDLKKSRLKTASEYASKEHKILVMKDARTVIATPEGKLYINVTGNNGMSTGGSGDVLSGLIGGLLAQGITPEEAAICGVLLHGLSGDHAALRKGVRSMIATDILDSVSEILKNADARCIDNSYVIK